MALVQKWPFFQLFFLGNLHQQNVFYDILERKNSFLRYQNKKSKKIENWHFSKGVKPWFWSKKKHFLTFFFLSYLGQENVFYDILEQKKTTFLRYKNKISKKQKNWHFCKGVNRWFWSKNGHFSIFFFLSNFGLENVFYDILERKNAFLDYKNKKQKKSKNRHFSQGVNPWFSSKKGHFSNFFFTQFRPEKCLLRYSRTKKPLSRLSEKEVQKVEKLTFFQGVNTWFWSKRGHFSSFFFRQLRQGKCLLRCSRPKKRLSTL